MKHRLIYLIPIIAVAVSLLSVVVPTTVSADTVPSSDGHPHAQITLTGTSSPTKYKVKGVLGSSTPISFTYGSGHFTSAVLPGVGIGCADNNAEEQNSLSVTITINGKTAADPFDMDFCTAGTNTLTQDVEVKSAATATDPATFTGTVQYKDQDGKLKSVKSDATGRLVGNHTYTLKFDDNGKITKKNVAPGDYKVSVDYAVPGGQNQNYTKNITIKAGQDFVLQNAIAGNVENPGNGSDPNASDTGADSSGELDCHAGWNPLNWLICGIVNGLVQVVNGVDSIINQLLSVGTTKDTLNGDPVKLFKCPTGDVDTCKLSDNPYYKAWSSFRNIALGLLVIASLVAIISQAIGMELLDAYTVRRVLPRLIFITIIITISWPLLEFAVQLSNSLGYGIRGLIMYPFSDLDSTLDIGGGGQGIGVMLATGAAIYAMGIFALLSFVATAALAAFVAFLTLVIRQILVILLVIVAPVAFVCYILPNTQRFYKIWFQSFSGALMMFPIIAAMIATGRVFSAVAINSGGQYGGNALGTLIAFAAYFAPYFLIPTAFKMSGAAMGAIGGFINSRAQGGFQGLSKYRSGQRDLMKEKNKSGTRWQGKTWIPGSTTLAGVGSEASKGLGAGWKGRYGLGKRGKQARANAGELASLQAGKNPELQAYAGDNNVNRILAEGYGDENRGREALRKHLLKMNPKITAEDLDARVDDAARKAKIAGGFTKANGVAGFRQMVQDGTAIENIEDQSRLAARVGGGDKNLTYGYGAWAAGASRQAGRTDLNPHTEAAGAYALALGDDIYNEGHAVLNDSGETYRQLKTQAILGSSKNTTQYEKQTSAKGRAIENELKDVTEVYHEAVADRESLLTVIQNPNATSSEKQAAQAGIAEAEQNINEAAQIVADTRSSVAGAMGKLGNRGRAIDALKVVTDDDDRVLTGMSTKQQEQYFAGGDRVEELHIVNEPTQTEITNAKGETIGKRITDTPKPVVQVTNTRRLAATERGVREAPGPYAGGPSREAIEAAEKARREGSANQAEDDNG